MAKKETGEESRRDETRLHLYPIYGHASFRTPVQNCPYGINLDMDLLLRVYHRIICTSMDLDAWLNLTNSTEQNSKPRPECLLSVQALGSAGTVLVRVRPGRKSDGVYCQHIGSALNTECFLPAG